MPIWKTILGNLFLTGGQLVPIFIHNPESQQIESVVMAEGAHLFDVLDMIQKPKATINPGATPPPSPTAGQ